MTQSNPKPTLEQRVQDLCDAIEAGGINKDTGTINDLGEMSILAFAQAVAAESAPRWIPVGERLPEQGLLVLCLDMKATELRHAFFVGWYVDGWIAHDTRRVNATHWQPIKGEYPPAAPTEGKS